MAGAMDLLGDLLQSGLRAPNVGRLEHSLGDKGIASKGGILEDLLGSLSGTLESAHSSSAATSSGGGLLDQLKQMATSALKDPKLQKAGGLGAIAGALLGGGGDSIKGAFGGGSMALLGMLACRPSVRRGLNRRWIRPPNSRLDSGHRKAMVSSAKWNHWPT